MLNWLPDRKMFWETRQRFYRRMAVKYRLDFEHRCAFWGQVNDIAHGLKDDWSTQEVLVPMESGRVALYELSKHDSGYGGTGQKDWRFKFLRYVDSDNADLRSDSQKNS